MFRCQFYSRPTPVGARLADSPLSVMIVVQSALVCGDDHDNNDHDNDSDDDDDDNDTHMAGTGSVCGTACNDLGAYCSMAWKDGCSADAQIPDGFTKESLIRDFCPKVCGSHAGAAQCVICNHQRRGRSCSCSSEITSAHCPGLGSLWNRSFRALRCCSERLLTLFRSSYCSLLLFK